MASALGRVAIPTEFDGANGFPAGTTRSIWVSVKQNSRKVANFNVLQYVRYIDWTVTTPALLLELLLATGLPLSDIITRV
jgi:bacteriorhodopsin